MEFAKRTNEAFETCSLELCSFSLSRRQKTNKAGKYGLLFGLETGKEGEHLSERLTKETLSWIRRQASGEKPFSAFLSHDAVHTPIEGKPEEVSYFETKLPSLPTPTEAAYRMVDG